MVCIWWGNDRSKIYIAGIRADIVYPKPWRILFRSKWRVSDYFPSAVNNFFASTNFSNLISLHRSVDPRGNERKGKRREESCQIYSVPTRTRSSLPSTRCPTRSPVRRISDARGRPGRLIHGPAGEPGIRTDKVVKSEGEEARGARKSEEDGSGRGEEALPSLSPPGGSSGERNTGPLISRYLNYRLAARTN